MTTAKYNKYEYKKPNMTQAQHLLMMEALRRFLKFNNQKLPLITAWTGLGYASHYKPVIDAGWMTWISGRIPSRRCMGWLRLTEEGAKIVQQWIDAGYTHLKFIERDWEYPFNKDGKLPPKHVEL